MTNNTMAAKRKKNLGGRPTKFDPGLTPRVKKFMLLGSSMEQLADFLDVHISQIYRWMEKDASFREAVMSGREEADANVAKSMYKRAVGMRIKATKIVYDKDRASMERHLACESARQMKADMLGQDLADVELTSDEILKITNMLSKTAGVIAVDYVEVLPPDVKAGIFWLTNRKGDSWKEKQEINQNLAGEVTHSIEWEEAPGCEPLKTAEELEAEAELENPRNVTDDEQDH